MLGDLLDSEPVFQVFSACLDHTPFALPGCNHVACRGRVGCRKATARAEGVSAAPAHDCTAAGRWIASHHRIASMEPIYHTFELFTLSKNGSTKDPTRMVMTNDDKMNGNYLEFLQ